MHQVIMPRLDPAMQSGKVIEWLKKEGDAVNKGEPVVLVEGEKTTFEIEAPGEGVVRKILYPIGADVPVTEVMMIIAEPSEPIPAELRVHEAIPAAPVAGAKATVFEEGLGEGERRASPAARRLAREYGIDLSTVKGSGPGGRIVREDVLAAAGKAKPLRPVAPISGAVGVRQLKVAKAIPLTGTRRTVAERLSYSVRTAVPVTVTMEADMEELIKQRELVGADRGIDLSITSFIVKAAAKALEEHLLLNSSLEGAEIKIYDEINVAVAVNTPDGLVAPVIEMANKKSIIEISKAIVDLSDKATRGKLGLEELTGGTFTVTNLGGFGVEIFAPVINPPQCAILGVGKTSRRPVERNGSVAIRNVATLSLVFDHRIVDGVPAAQFLEKVKTLLENPTTLIS